MLFELSLTHWELHLAKVDAASCKSDVHITLASVEVVFLHFHLKEFY